MPTRNRLTQPKPIGAFVKQLADTMPDATIEIDAPADRDGEWWLDIADDDFTTAIAWRPDRGFGVFLAEEVGIGDRPDEIYERADLLIARLEQLRARQGRSSPTTGLTLTEVRQLRGARQQALAEALASSQGAVSRLENREDMRLSSLRAYVRALGGELELRVRFDGFEAPLEAADDRSGDA